MKPHTTKAGRKTHQSRPIGLELCEHLEPRTMLTATPFPLLSALDNPNDTVVRMETNFGDVDFELFDSGAQNATAMNFIHYIHAGRLDQTFFHRLETVGVNNSQIGVLQGGGFTFDNTAGLKQVTPFAAIALEDTGHSNLARTISMARTNTLDSATSQFFINTVDNTALDTAGGGYAVFGKVVQGWSIIQTIIAAQVRDLTANPAMNTEQPAFNLDGTSANQTFNPSGNFSTVPTTAAFDGTTVRYQSLATVDNIEVIKPQGSQLYYTSHIFYPEGFAGATINEFLPIVNPNNTDVYYQLIAHFENGLETNLPLTASSDNNRDLVMVAEIIQANHRGGPTISSHGDNGVPGADDLVRQGRPYALEIQSTMPVAAQLSHYDFNTATGEAFATTPGTTWSFGEVNKGSRFKDFILWENTAAVQAVITVTFYSGTGGVDPITFLQVAQPYRRGGLDISQLSQISDGEWSVQLSSDQPIVAAETQYRDGGTAMADGFTTLGVTGVGSIFGVVPIASVGPDAQGQTVSQGLSVLNTGSAGALLQVTLTFDDPVAHPDLQFPGGGPPGLPLLVQPGHRVTWDLSNIVASLPQGLRFSIVYVSNQPVLANSVHHELGDDVGDPVATQGSTSWHFAEGFMNAARAGHDLFEFVGVYNPNSSLFGVTDQTANVTLKFRYNDGFVITKNFTVAAGRRLEVDLHTVAEILAQAVGVSGRYFFSTEVASDIPVVAEMWHFDQTLGLSTATSGGFGTLGTPLGTLTPLGGTPG
jgi:peptidyl-prolyl cis-trans isomerase A (cyclophilin A)